MLGLFCRELLSGVHADASPQAEERTAGYYKKRPCELLVGQAAAILESYLNSRQ